MALEIFLGHYMPFNTTGGENFWKVAFKTPQNGSKTFLEYYTGGEKLWKVSILKTLKMALGNNIGMLHAS